MNSNESYHDYIQHFLPDDELKRLHKKEEEVGLKYHERNLLHKDEWARKLSRLREFGSPTGCSFAHIEHVQHIMNLSLAEYNASRQALEQELEEAVQLDRQVGLCG